MQPVNDFTPCPDTPLGRKLEKIMMIRECVIIGKRLGPMEVSPDAVASIRIRYLSLFRELVYEDIGLSVFTHAENACNFLLYIYDILQSVSAKEIISFRNSFGVPYMLSYNKLISHKKGESINDFVLTTNGSMFLILLKEYLEENPAKDSKTSLTEEGPSASGDDWSGMSS